MHSPGFCFSAFARCFLSWLWLGLWPLGLFAQFANLNGSVLDEASHEPVPFCRVTVKGEGRGAVANLDGRFQLMNVRLSDSLRFESLGYFPTQAAVADFVTANNQAKVIYMRPDTLSTEVVEIRPGENPALRIVRNAIENRNLNDPEQRAYFAYHSYNKVRMMPDFGLVPFSAIDDTILSRADMFIMETVTERIYKAPNRSRERVLATRASGFKSFAIPLTPTDIQDLSFYRNWVKVMGEDFLSPLATQAPQRYGFYLEDTLYDGPDSVFVMQFMPLQAGYYGFKGQVHIRSGRWNLEQIDADLRVPEDNLFLNNFRLQQVHRQVAPGVWFPVQMLAAIHFQEQVQVGVRSTTGDTVNGSVRMTIRSDLSNIVLDTLIRGQAFSNIALELDPNALQNAEAVLAQFRTDSLTARELATYTVIDSVSDELKLERRARRLLKLAQGKLQLGPVDLELSRAYMYNRVEFHRLGLGLATNEQVAKKWQLGGWAGYGTRDAYVKHGVWAEVAPFFNPFWRLRFAYADDLVETGLNDMAVEPTRLLHRRPEWDRNTRYLFLSWMQYVRRAEASLFFPSLRSFSHRATLRTEGIRPAFAYDYVGTAAVNIAEAVFETRWAPKERFLRSLTGLSSLGTEWPVVLVRLTAGLDGSFGGQFGYRKLEAVVSHIVNLSGVGQFYYQASGGVFSGNVPFPKAYTFRANGAPSQLAQLTAFNAMPMNQFAATRYATLQLAFTLQNHTFPGPKWRPTPSLAAGAASGEYAGLATTFPPLPPAELAPPHQAPSLGYYEAGITLTNLLPEKLNQKLSTLRFLGVGVFQRMGPYAIGEWQNNLFWKVAFNLPIGF